MRVSNTVYSIAFGNYIYNFSTNDGDFYYINTISDIETGRIVHDFVSLQHERGENHKEFYSTIRTFKSKSNNNGGIIFERKDGSNAKDSNVGGSRISNGRISYTRPNNGKSHGLESVQVLLSENKIIFGAAINGQIYLNEEFIKADTPLHEYTHLWDVMLQTANPEMWEAGKELLKQSKVRKKVINDPNYSDIANDEDRIASEFHSRLSGRNNAKKLIDMADDMLNNAKNESEKEEAQTLIDKIKRAIKDFWNSVVELLGSTQKFTNVYEITDSILYDIINKSNVVNEYDDSALTSWQNIYGINAHYKDHTVQKRIRWLILGGVRKKILIIRVQIM